MYRWSAHKIKMAAATNIQFWIVIPIIIVSPTKKFMKCSIEKNIYAGLHKNLIFSSCYGVAMPLPITTEIH